MVFDVGKSYFASLREDALPDRPSVLVELEKRNPEAKQRRPKKLVFGESTRRYLDICPHEHRVPVSRLNIRGAAFETPTQILSGAIVVAEKAVLPALSKPREYFACGIQKAVV